ncbi:hypothetical protein PRIPAC_75231 [Pristionchus pacificus]|uniref:CRAL-TRIO domain containing protein n=1 Tax=Pristionchus pacificus TaxID=54126 RepID=A0A2A6D0N5_PRIPA|nr:hypothetical protein PRIPAC_75231 [Pristionchus pacificus]|eukprot:PDM83843.1 CRAL-TRIO domain containing protein [Pristionchus pacificus]
MTRISTDFGHPLTPESKKLVDEVRAKLKEKIHPQFDTDFNIYRFIINSERLHKKEKEVVDFAVKALNNHLRIRRAFKLDTDRVKTFDENPVFTKNLMPRGDIQVDMVDKHNRLMWYIDYASVTVETLAHTEKSSSSVKFQFWQFEYMLRLVMAQEAKTGKLSGLHHIIDMAGYEINPFTMLFVSSGTMSYYTQLFHYENFPELVSPGSMVNIARWIWLPYKLIKPVMPAGFADRFILHDSSFYPALKEEVGDEHIPVSLGGKNTEIKCIPAIKKSEDEYWKPKDNVLLDSLESIHVHARKKKHIRVDVNEVGKKISWYFRTDGDVYFGIFFVEGSGETIEEAKKEKKEEIDTEEMEMVYPYWKLTAKLVHERDELVCEKTGRYYLVFGNEHSWLTKRGVDLIVNVEKGDSKMRIHADNSQTVATIEF